MRRAIALAFLVGAVGIGLPSGALALDPPGGEAAAADAQQNAVVFREQHGFDASETTVRAAAKTPRSTPISPSAFR